MSLVYDDYIKVHIGYVSTGLRWMEENLDLSDLGITSGDFSNAHWRAANHDESKYDKEEYEAYDNYFYGGNRSFKVVQDFNYAWLHHIHNNPHHWQYWVLINDNEKEGTIALEMPKECVLEMIADWWSFSWKEGNLFEIFNWYADHRAKQYIHRKSRKILERILKKIWDVLIMQETVRGRDISEIERQYKRFWAEQDNNAQNYHDLFLESGKPPILTIAHQDSEPIGNVIGVIETENGFEVTVAYYSKDKQGLLKYLIEDGENDITHSVDHLEHHGIIGQKWGVRRYQNKDGTRTAEGKKLEHYRRRTVRELKNVDAVNKIVASLPREEQLALGVGRDDKEWIPKDRRAEISSNIAKTFIEYDGDEPVSMLEIWDIGNGKADIALATNPKYRGTGVTSKNIKAAVNWFNSSNNKEFDQLQWNNLKMNPKSGQIAEHYGFGDYDEDDKWEYRRIFKNEPIKHSELEDDEDLYGVPELKKFPMPDADHVKSAIRFFNYVDLKYEKELAEAILERMKEYGMSFEDFGVGDENRFKNYIPKKEINNEKE